MPQKFRRHLYVYTCTCVCAHSRPQSYVIISNYDVGNLQKSQLLQRICLLCLFYIPNFWSFCEKNLILCRKLSACGHSSTREAHPCRRGVLRQRPSRCVVRRNIKLSLRNRFFSPRIMYSHWSGTIVPQPCDYRATAVQLSCHGCATTNISAIFRYFVGTEISMVTESCHPESNKKTTKANK